MKLLLSLITLAGLVAAIVTHPGGKPALVAGVEASEAATVTIPDSETAAEIKAMPACKAVLEQDGTCVYLFKTTGGRKFYIGSPASPPEVIQFLQTLKEGQTYKFPDVFLAYQKKHGR